MRSGSSQHACSCTLYLKALPRLQRAAAWPCAGRCSDVFMPEAARRCTHTLSTLRLLCSLMCAPQAQDLLRMERILLDSLEWHIKTPTAYNFLHLYTQGTAAKRASAGALPAASEPLTGAVVAKAAYLIELALMDYTMLRFCPSLVAASALMLAESWSPNGAAEEEIKLLSGERTAQFLPLPP